MSTTTRKLQHHVGIWAGPGILVLVGGVWLHLDPDAFTPALRDRATAWVGIDSPRIAVRRVEGAPTARAREKRGGRCTR